MPVRRPATHKSALAAALRGAATACVCLGLIAPADLLATFPHAKAAHKAPKPIPLSPDQRILHALNRLTFGPKPGDAAQVRRLGLDAWFQQQLHPEAISDMALDTRLAQFPAMQLPQPQLIADFPSPELLKQYNRGAVAAPDDVVERTIYADAGFEYQEKREAKQAAKATSTSEPAAPTQPTSAPNPPSPDQAQALLTLPAAERYAHLLAMSPEDMQDLRSSLKGGKQEQLYIGLAPAQIEQVAAMQSPERVIGAEVLSARLLRDVYSQRQLQAVMTDFWLNHFSVYARKNGNEPYLLPAYEREAILPHALGSFEDLLKATATSPAMLVYLDNWESIGPNSRAAGRVERLQAARPDAPIAKLAAKIPKGINENYARELMELHTLGVNGGYTQQDVIEVAKCFTGWTIAKPADGAGFTFNPNRHEPGPKTVLGHVIPEGGEQEGLAVLHILATSPATAHFVSTKLAQRFVADDPPPALVNRMSAAFLKSNGDIATVLSTIFHSPEFWSPQVYRAKVKTPIEFVASALRASDADVTNPVPLVQAVAQLGMPIYGMQTPNGYSWQSEPWVSSGALLARMNFALVLSGNRLRGTHLDWPTLASISGSATPDPATEQRLEHTLLGEGAATQTRNAVLAEAADPTAQSTAEQNFRAASAATPPGVPGATRPAGLLRTGAALSKAAAAPESPLATMAGLLLGSPDFQRR